MDTIRDHLELQARCQDWRARGLKVGLVPTMGYFHAGHLSLMDRARELADRVVVSLFVNPTQFGENEDLDAYPRDAERDARLASEHGVDLLFTPERAAMYPEGAATWVEVPELAKGLCGASRPIHFRGVATVVAKLFNLVLPHYAVFGQKDWQQLALIRRMAEALFFPIEVVGGPIVREADGLAMSSRNVNLDPGERAQAPAIRQGLLELQSMVSAGERDAARLADWLKGYYAHKIGLGRVDYVSLVEPVSLSELKTIENEALAAVAVFFSRARLIDNLLVKA